MATSETDSDDAECLVVDLSACVSYLNLRDPRSLTDNQIIIMCDLLTIQLLL